MPFCAALETRSPSLERPWLGPGLLAWVALAAVCTAGLVHDAEPTHESGESTLERIRRLGVVRIGFANEPPFGYLDVSSGEVRGEAPTVARWVLRRLGVERVEPVVTEFGALIPGLQAGRFDLVAAGMYVTPERCREVDFSRPTYSIGESFLVRTGNPLGLRSFAAVARHDDARLGVVGGTIEHTYARVTNVPEDRILVFPDNASAVAALEASRIDAFAATSLTVDDLLAKLDRSDIERAEPFEDPVIDGRVARGYGAFAFRKTDDDLRAAFDTLLDSFLGTREHLELVAPFGFSERTLPGEVSVEELCEKGS